MEGGSGNGSQEGVGANLVENKYYTLTLFFKKNKVLSLHSKMGQFSLLHY